MLIHVTSDHIKIGRRGKCQFCPVALAIKDATRYDGVRVTGKSVSIDYAGRHAHVWLPHKAQQFVIDFDSYLNASPFSFELPEPVWSGKC